MTVRQREQDIVDATRALFDERGMQEVPIDDIARAVGLSRALIYRHFSSKEELFILTVTRYLAELSGRLDDAAASSEDHVERLEAVTGAFADFALEYPAFLDCAISLLRRPHEVLQELVSDAVWFRLGQGMASCLGVCADVLRDGSAAGVFTVEDPDFSANHLWAAALGTMHLARSGVRVSRTPDGVPNAAPVDAAVVRAAAMHAARAIATS
ncbi:MAG: TetR/AcrR family transcriptional regulator [Solirubrobacteraceae bacterium]